MVIIWLVHWSNLLRNNKQLNKTCLYRNSILTESSVRLERGPRSNLEVDFYTNCFPIEALRLRVRCEGECCRTAPITHIFIQTDK